MAIFAHNILMIYLFGLLAGFINGIFASGAGQIIVFAMVFVMHLQTHESRATSVFCIGIVTVISLIRYVSFVSLDIIDVFKIIFFGLIFGLVGTKIMRKIPSKILNILSGIIIVVFSIYNLVA